MVASSEESATRKLPFADEKSAVRPCTTNLAQFFKSWDGRYTAR